LIMDHCQALLPSYLRFVKGVVDSADLPLNISREMVQQDRHITQMRQWLTRKVLDHLLQLLERNRDTYLELWREFGPVLKEGLGIDAENRERLLPLLLCESSASPDALTTLGEYTTRMKPEQDAIYYLTGESRLIVEHSPHLEAFQSRGYEVLYFVDPVDELLTQTVTEFEGKPLKSVGKGHVDLGSEEERKQQQEELKDKSSAVSALLSRLQKSLDEWVKEVRLSNRLTTSPACLVSSAEDLSPGLERMLRRAGGAALPTQKRILELNPKHELLDKLETRFSQHQDDPLVDDYAHLLYGYALLAEGSAPPDPARFNRLFGELLTRSL
jgi:molecular chaperone HtpG